MKIVGITGGIACGKSTVTNMILYNNIPVIDADSINHELQKPGSECLGLIAEKFGPEVINHDGSLNRKLLGSIVFSDASRMKDLEAIMHPKINELILHAIDNFRENCEPVIFIDNPLLIETGWYQKVDKVWVVHTNYETQLKRLMNRNHLTRDEAEKRINAQLPAGIRLSHADVIIYNDGFIEETKGQVEKELKKLMDGCSSG